jgi:pyroglutamyl-peptidase
MKILLVGFKEFLNHDYNPSGEMAKRFDKQKVSGARISGLVLPVEHKEAIKVLKEKINAEKPDAIIALGLAAGRGYIALERVAQNRYFYTDAKKESDEPLHKGGNPVYYSTLPLSRIREKLRSSGIPSEYSFFADTYLCNEVFYEAMAMAEKGKIRSSGFIHLPLTHMQIIKAKKFNAPSMDESTIEKAVRIAISETCEALK